MTTTNETSSRQLISPVDGRVLGIVDPTSPAEVAKTAARLRAAQPEWQALGPAGRAAWLKKWTVWLADNNDRLVELVVSETGKSLGDAAGEPAYGASVVEYWLARGEEFLADDLPESSLSHHILRIQHAPYPLVGVISPWNGPLSMPMLDVPAALMAGCAVLSKPSDLTPLTWREVVRGWREDVGAPDVLACVPGDALTGAAVVDEVDMVQFTGSVQTGRAVARRAADRLIPASLELGGKDAMLVLADADLERAAAGAVWAACFNVGQGCSCVERVYVDVSVHDEFVALVVQKAQALRQGSGTNGPVDLGAMTSEAQLELVERHVADAVAKGARVLTGGQRGEGPGWYYPPTVLVDVDHTMDVMVSETFGPIIPVMRVADAAEGMRYANDSDYGLCGSVWTADADLGLALAGVMEAGAVCVNDVCSTNFQMELPSGGWKSSGIGHRFGGRSGILKYTRARALLTTSRTPPKEAHWYPAG
ncbi:aldehyde dehydrogenase family protein [Rhodococcus rhodochrous]|uniref:aldehyde dehydrogenase family protein n=1 Tax=Rhodococcus rhodochrous TaxID=1829 RepID=UPI0027E1AF92|nr:aldehyde dehydrogenase family protein [Rhodococcus rhodochrous]MCB8913436.1 aldehyde dehydrogenase family protein [Rhodococcus rhodochrous]